MEHYVIDRKNVVQIKAPNCILSIRTHRVLLLLNVHEKRKQIELQK